MVYFKGAQGGFAVKNIYWEWFAHEGNLLILQITVQAIQLILKSVKGAALLNKQQGLMIS